MTDFLNELKNKNILVMGYGVTGVSVANFLNDVGAIVYVYDDNIDTIDSLRAEKTEYLHIDDSTIYYPDNINLYREDIGYKYIILSPSIKPNHHILAKHSDAIIMAELELAFKCFKKNIIAVTGTNGKTTITSMLEKVFNQASIKGVAVGNIGKPFIDVVRNPNIYPICEVSSFQLLSLNNYSAEIVILSNIAEDHLDFHTDFNEYINCKYKLIAMQNASGITILNYDDELSVKGERYAQGRIYYYSVAYHDRLGIYIEKDSIYFRNCKNEIKKLYALNEFTNISGFNISNILPVICVGVIKGLSLREIHLAINEYKFSNFRNQYIGTACGKAFYNDSKATNIHSTQGAISSINGNIGLIVGGVDKNLDYYSFFKNIDDKVKCIVAVGDNAHMILNSAVKAGFNACHILQLLKDGVEYLCKNDDIDTILFSPTTSSYDRYTSYKQRGEHFDKIFKEIKFKI